MYIPLGGSRVSPLRRYGNILIVWMLTGLWHGASWNFVIWGLYFAVLLMIEKVVLLEHLEKYKILSHVYVIVAVIISFVIFDASSLGNAFATIGGMFGAGIISAVSAEASYYLKSYAVLFVIAILGVTPIPKRLISKVKWAEVLEPVILLMLLIIVTAYLVDGSFNPFLYFRF